MAERLFILAPTVVLAARVNLASPTFPISLLPVDEITSGALVNVKAGMTLLLGSSAGRDDYGRQRVRSVDGSTIKVGHSSQGVNDGELYVVDNAYVTVLNDHRIWSKPVSIAADGTVYKDGDLTSHNVVNLPPPVPNGGPGYAGTANTGTGLATVNFSSSDAFGFSPITGDFDASVTRLWDVKDGTITVGTNTSTNITATFPSGFRWVELTVTLTSTGISSKQYIPVFVRDPSVENSIKNFHITNHSRRPDGQTLSITIYDQIPASQYPDGTLVMLWDDALESSAVTRPQVQFIGWMDRVDFAANSASFREKETQIHCIDTAGRLAQLPGFSQIVVKPYYEIRVREAASVGATQIETDEVGVFIPSGTVLRLFGKPDTQTLTVTVNVNANAFIINVAATTFELVEGDYIAYPKTGATGWSDTLSNNVFYYLYYLLQWHTTALEIINLKDIDTSLRLFKFIRFSSDEGNVWEQLSTAATRVVPDNHLNVTKEGSLVIVHDPMILTPTDRTTFVAVAETILSSEWTSISVSRNRSPRIHELTAWAVKSDDIGLTGLRSKAPGNAIGSGVQRIETNEHVAFSQFDLNYSTGNRYARLNAPFEKFSISLPSEKFPVNFDPAYMDWVNLVIDTYNESLRGLLAGATLRGMVHEMTIQYEYAETGTIRTISLNWELETSGGPGITVVGE